MWHIRQAQPHDHDAVVALWEAAGLGTTTAGEWQAIITGTSARVLVAEEDTALVGAAVAAFDGWRAYIYHVAVAPTHRRRGLAKALMTAAEHHLRSRGARRVYTLVNEENTPGLALTAALGYEPEGDIGFVKELPP